MNSLDKYPQHVWDDFSKNIKRCNPKPKKYTMKKIFDFILGGAIYLVPFFMIYALVGLHMIIVCKWLYVGIGFEVFALASLTYWLLRKW